MKIEDTFWEQREVIGEHLYLQAPEGSPEGESEQEFRSVCMNFRIKFRDKEVDLHNGCVADVTAPGTQPMLPPHREPRVTASPVGPGVRSSGAAGTEPIFWSLYPIGGPLLHSHFLNS